MMILIAALIATAPNDVAIKAEGWARKAKPIASCTAGDDCREKWSRATAWVRNHSRFQIAVDREGLFATYGTVYANTDLSFVLVLDPDIDGRRQIRARAWCGNDFTCKPKPKESLAALTRELG